jgi:DNA polymerase elongation subunit (family B)
MFDLMGPTFFYLNQSIPKTFQQLINEATGSQLDSFMIRAYLQDGYSQPQTSQKEEFEGAISFGIPGNYKNVFSVDFHALYPSIIKQYKIYDKKKDPSAYMLEATKYFTEVRVEYKNKFKETGNIMYDGMQQAAKVCANSIYGFMGSGYLLYNSPSNAALVTKHGRDLLDTICRKSTGIGVLEWKTQIK